MTNAGYVALAAAVLLIPACDRPDAHRVEFAVTHTDQMEHPHTSPVDLPPEPAFVQGDAGAVVAQGLIAAPDACDDLGAQFEMGDALLTLRVIVRGSRGHLGGCGGPGRISLSQWRARVAPVDPGPCRVRVLYDYRGLNSHSTGEAEGRRDAYRNRIVAEGTVTVQ